MQDFWNSRYSAEEYAYGTTPNEFLKSVLISRNITGKILFVAEGEGRNAVYAAKKGLDVYAFDIAEEGRKKALTLTYDDSTFYCRPKYFGSYSIKRDITPPTVSSINFTTSTAYTTRTSLQWRISDSQIGINDYDLFIDGEWVLVEYDYKSGLVTYERDASFVGSKELKFIVKDECGNSTEWTSTIEFK